MKKFSTVQKLIPVMDIEPNNYNPNQQDEKLFKKLIDSIKENGFTSAILVRTIEPDKKWQIIDGEHRWRACIELDYEKIKVEDIGIIDDLTAKMLTIALNNIRGQDDVLKRAEILQMLNEGQLALLPWDKEEIKNELELVKFNWDKYNQEEKVEEKKEYTICFSLTKPEYLIVKHALEVTKKEHTKALLVMVESWLQICGVDISKYKDVFKE